MKKVIITTISLAFILILSGYPNHIDDSIVVDGMKRTYHLYIPNVYDGRVAVPLLLVFHGYGGNAKNVEKRITLEEFDRLAEEYNFIVVYPDGMENIWGLRLIMGRVRFWRLWPIKNKDIKFISKLIDELCKKCNIDLNKIYAVGFSNGGIFCFLLACELSNKICKIATVAASLPRIIYKRCSPSRKVSVIMFHGTDDPIVPWNGGMLKSRIKILSVEDTFNFWREKNGLSLCCEYQSLPDKDPGDGTKVYKKECGDKNVKIVLYKIKGGGHTWPDGKSILPPYIVGRVCHDINACKIIWDFFRETK